jgi:hypothetical protein
MSMRVAADLAAQYIHHGRVFQAARIIEVSTSGLQLRAYEPIAVRSMGEIKIRVDRRRTRICGQIVRIVQGIDDAFDYGVKLVNDPGGEGRAAHHRARRAHVR